MRTHPLVEANCGGRCQRPKSCGTIATHKPLPPHPVSHETSYNFSRNQLQLLTKPVTTHFIFAEKHAQKNNQLNKLNQLKHRPQTATG